MSDRIRLYPYNVTFIDRVDYSNISRIPVYVFSEIVRAPNSEEAKKTFLDIIKDTRSVIFLTSTRYPDSWDRPDSAKLTKLKPYQIKLIQEQVGSISPSSTHVTPSSTFIAPNPVVNTAVETVPSRVVVTSPSGVVVTASPAAEPDPVEVVTELPKPTRRPVVLKESGLTKAIKYVSFIMGYIYAKLRQ